MAGHLRDQVLSLLAAANNHGDLAVKLSSLRQVRDLLSSMDSSLAAEVFPYLVELQSSPESLVRKLLIEVIEEVGLKGLEHSAILMPVLFSLIKDAEPIVARQSIVSGIKFFYAVLEDIAMQLHRRGEVERWTEGMWTWMTRIMDAIYSILFETTSLETKLLAMKFMETLVLIFTSDESNLEKSTSGDNGCAFNVSWLINGVSFVNPTELTSEANKFLFTFLDMLRSPNNLPGPLAIAVVNCLASIARKRTTYHYATVFSALLEFNGNYEVVKGGHASSLQYSVRCAFLGFLRSTHPVIIKSRESLVRALRGMNAGDAADQVLRQVDKTLRNQERALHDARATEDSKVINQQPLSGDVLRKRPILDEPNSMEMAYKRPRPNSNGQSSHILQANDYGPEHSSSNGALPKASVLSSSLHPVEQMIAMIAALLAEGERGAQSLELLISQIHPDLLADIVIANMKHLPKSAPLTNYGTFPADTQNSSLSGSAQVATPVAATSMQALPLSPQGSITSAAAVITSVSDLPSSLNQADSKRDPRRDPRRVDPRRVPTEPPTQHIKEEAVLVQSELDIPASSSVPNSLAGTPHEVNSSAFLSPSSAAEREINGGSLTTGINRLMPEDVELNEAEETPPSLEISVTKDYSLSSPCALDEKKGLTALPDNEPVEAFSASRFEPDELSPSVSNASESEESCQDLPPVPAFVDLSMEQQQMMREEAVKRVVGSTKKIESTDCCQMRMAIVARLVSQFLVRRGVLVIATPYASGFDHFLIADEAQFKFDRCIRCLQEVATDLPTFGIGHSLGSVIHLLIGSRYAVQRNGNVLMSFNNKEASVAVPLFSPVLVPVVQRFGPLLAQIASSPTVRFGAEMTLKQLENLSPSVMKQVLPLVEQLPPLYMDLVQGREDFIPKPEETRKLVKAYYGLTRNLLIKFKDDTIDETSTLAQVLTVDSAVSSMLDISIRTLPGDHGLPLQQALPDVPPAMADAVNLGGEFLANVTVGTPWEAVAKDVGTVLGVDSKILRTEVSKDLNELVDVITAWMTSNTGPKLLRS